MKKATITIEVEASDKAEYVAVDECGRVYEYVNIPIPLRSIKSFCAYGMYRRPAKVTNWRETVTKPVEGRRPTGAADLSTVEE